MDFVKDAVTLGTRIDKDNGVFGGVEIFEDDIDHVVLFISLVRRIFEMKRRIESFSLNLLLHHVCRQGDVDGPGLNPAFSNSMIDQCGCFVRVGQFGHGAGYVLAHVGKDLEVAIAKGVMEKHAISLRECGWCADNVDDGNVFRVATSNCIEKTQLPNAKSCNDSGYAFDSCVAVCCVAFMDR